jgi:hypothetical protein
MQDGMHLFSDWHFHAASVGKSDCGCCGEDSFGNHAMHGSDDVGEFASAAEFDAYAAVSRQAASAG